MTVDNCKLYQTVIPNIFALPDVVFFFFFFEQSNIAFSERYVDTEMENVFIFITFREKNQNPFKSMWYR